MCCRTLCIILETLQFNELKCNQSLRDCNQPQHSHLHSGHQPKMSLLCLHHFLSQLPTVTKRIRDVASFLELQYYLIAGCFSLEVLAHMSLQKCRVHYILKRITAFLLASSAYNLTSRLEEDYWELFV